MAQKLTEQEHDAIVSLAKLLSKELPVQQRSVSGGIASGLVRLRKNPLSREDVMGVLAKYGAGEPTLKDLLDLHVLEREKGSEGYVLLAGGALVHERLPRLIERTYKRLKRRVGMVKRVRLHIFPVCI